MNPPQHSRPGQVRRSVPGNIVPPIRSSKRSDARYSHAAFQQDVHFRSENAALHQNRVTKDIEVIVEKPVINKIMQDVPYDVYVERPVEKIVREEVVYEEEIIREVEKITEVPVEKIVKTQREEVHEDIVIYEKVVPKEIKTKKEHEVVYKNVVTSVNPIPKEVVRRTYQPHRHDVETELVPVPVNFYVDEEHVTERIEYYDVPEPYPVVQKQIEYYDVLDTKTVEVPVPNVRTEVEVQTQIEYEDVPVPQPYDVHETVVKYVDRPVPQPVPEPRIQKVTKYRDIVEPEYHYYDVPVPNIIEQRRDVVEKVLIPEPVVFKVKRDQEVVTTEIREVVVPEIIENRILQPVPVPFVVTTFHDVDDPYEVEVEVPVPEPKIEVIHKTVEVPYEEIHETTRVEKVRKEKIEYYDVVEIVYEDEKIIKPRVVDLPYEQIEFKEIVRYIEVPDENIHWQEERLNSPTKKRRRKVENIHQRETEITRRVNEMNANYQSDILKMEAQLAEFEKEEHELRIAVEKLEWQEKHRQEYLHYEKELST